MKLLTGLLTLLLAQVISCSTDDGSQIKAICQTDKSYVLHKFRNEATNFQQAVANIQDCVNRGFSIQYCTYPQCKSIDNFYNDSMIKVPSTDSRVPLTNLKVSEIHSAYCDNLKKVASVWNYPSDIELADYDLLSETGRQRIEKVLDTGMEVNTNDDAIKKAIVLYLKESSLYDRNRPDKDQKYTTKMLKIELNRYINQEIQRFVERNDDVKADLDEGEYSWELSDEEIESLKKTHIEKLKKDPEKAHIENLEKARIEKEQKDLEAAHFKEAKWFWIKAAGVCVIVLISAIVIFYLKFKKETDIDEEEANEPEDIE